MTTYTPAMLKKEARFLAKRVTCKCGRRTYAMRWWLEVELGGPVWLTVKHGCRKGHRITMSSAVKL